MKCRRWTAFHVTIPKQTSDLNRKTGQLKIDLTRSFLSFHTAWVGSSYRQFRWANGCFRPQSGYTTGVFFSDAYSSKRPRAAIRRARKPYRMTGRWSCVSFGVLSILLLPGLASVTNTEYLLFGANTPSANRYFSIKAFSVERHQTSP